MLILWTLIMGARQIDSHPLEYELEKFDRSPGIYYESLGRALLYSTEWKVIVYLPLSTTKNQLTILESYVGYIEWLCARIDLRSWTACNH